MFGINEVFLDTIDIYLNRILTSRILEGNRYCHLSNSKHTIHLKTFFEAYHHVAHNVLIHEARGVPILVPIVASNVKVQRLNQITQ